MIKFEKNETETEMICRTEIVKDQSEIFGCIQIMTKQHVVGMLLIYILFMNLVITCNPLTSIH